MPCFNVLSSKTRTMSASDLAKEKLVLIDWIIRNEKASQIKSLSDFVHKMDNDSKESLKIAGYRAKGIPVTFSQLHQYVMDSLEEIENGKFISLEQLEHDSDQW